MTPWNIEIDDAVYDELKRHAEPFVDTPNTVLRRLLDLPARPSSPELTEASLEFAGLRAAPRPADKVSPKRTRRAKAPGRKRRTRAPAHSLLPDTEYELPILRVLSDAGGRLPTREAVAAVGTLVRDRLTDLDQEETPNGGLRWQSRIQFKRLQMVKDGLLIAGSPRGVWEISDAGRAKLAETQVGAA
jgi:hypothetical protein